jgi:protein-disulfide isomerase
VSRLPAPFPAILLAALLGACVLTPALAEPAARPLSQRQGEAILDELRQIRLLLQKQQAQPAPTGQPGVAANPANPTPLRAVVSNLPSLGQATAPLTMVLYTDYECPFCRRFEKETLPQLRQQYIDNGKLKLVIKDLPLSMHANAQKAAEANHCAAEQGRYWPYRQRLTALGEPLAVPRLAALAEEVGLDRARFEECLRVGLFAPAVAHSVNEAGRLGIDGTPTFILGREHDGYVEGQRIVGALPLATFAQKIDALLGPP